MSPQSLPARRRGFSFVELLFAIAVLGIGFIMIAAVFPVGLQQTKITLDETAGAAGSRSMAARLQQVAQGVSVYILPNSFAALPETFAPRGATASLGSFYPGQVRTLNDPRQFVSGANSDARRYYMWQAVANDLINPADSRNASAVLFKRDSIVVPGPPPFFRPAPTAQVIVINTQNANQSTYGSNDVSATGPVTAVPKLPIFNLEPRPVAVQIVFDPGNQNFVASFFSVRNLDKGPSDDAAYARGGYPTGNFVGTPVQKWDDVLDEAVNAVAEGAFVVISDDRITTAGMAGRMNGRTFRLGNRRTDLSGLTFDLAPGYDFTPDAGVDGVLNTSTTPSADDIVCIGADKAETTLASGITYATPAKIEKPKGTNGPNGTNVLVAGTAGKKGAVALVIGRGFTNLTITPPGVAANPSAYAGPVQDVSLYTTFVSVPNP